MLFSISIGRCSFLISPKILDFALKMFPFRAYSSTAAEIFHDRLQKDQANVEKSLSSVKAKLDARCISQVLEKCAIDKPLLGARFFLWAGLHPSHRHTSFMYEKACKLLDVERNPRLIMDVLNCYMSEGFAVSIKMFKLILNICRAAKDADLSLLVLRRMKEFNCRPDTVCYNVVIRLFVQKGRLDEAMGLMKEMGLIDLYPDMITYISILKGLCDAGKLEDACCLIKVMKRHGCVPNAVVFSTLLDGICSHGDLEATIELLCEIEKENGESKPNVVTYTGIVKGLLDKGRAMEALLVLDRMDDSKVKPNRVTFAALLDGLCMQGHVDEACKVVDRYGGRALHYGDLYCMLVVSLLRAGKHNDSEKMFRLMISQGMRPSGLASSCIIRMIISEGRVLDGFLLVDTLEKSGDSRFIDSDVCSLLLAALCKENHFTEAAKLVHVMVDGNIRLSFGHAENIIKHLEVCGQEDLLSDVLRIAG